MNLNNVDSASIVRAAILSVALAALVVCSLAHAATTLERVRQAGQLRCGIDVEEAEYSTADDHGSHAAFDADLCQAVAVAVLGKQARVVATSYPDDRAAMSALGSGAVDLLPTLSDDFTHAVGTHLSLTRPVLWDGVGFLVPGASTVARARQLSGKKICFLSETTVEESVRVWFSREHLEFVPFPFQEEGEMQAAFTSGNCAALAGDRTRLAQTRAQLAQHGRRARLLPECISKDPMAAATRDDDPQWSAVVSWVLEALLQAEESGVTRANVRQLRARAVQPAETDSTLRFLLGGSREIGGALGLDDDWVVRVIETTGNYGEIYERDLGRASAIKLPRGENNLRDQGGLLLALPPK